MAADGEGLVMGGNRLVMGGDDTIELLRFGTEGVRRGVVACWGGLAKSV